MRNAMNSSRSRFSRTSLAFMLLTLFACLCFTSPSFAKKKQQDDKHPSAPDVQKKTTPEKDSLALHLDSVLQTRSDSTDSLKKSSLEFPVIYSAKDSIVLFQSGNAFMYGESNVKYGEINLTADYIHLNTDSTMVDAAGRPSADDSTQFIGTPVFIDHGEEYKASTIRYNYDTKKGFVRQALLQQGDGYVIGEETKKVDDDIFLMRNGHYTTCSNHEHPHYYLNLTKAKVKQDKWVTSGPAYMVLMDVPLPVAIPFGFFPFTKSYSSGVIIPSYGDEMARGFYLSDGGYYFAINDYVDLAVTGDIYTKGTWALRGESKYVKRYKFNGNFSINYRNDVYGEKDVPGYYKYKNFAVKWTHTQNPKSIPNSTFSASVNFTSSGYDRSDINSYYNPSLLTQNTKSSSISYSHNFPNTPFSITTSLLASQRTSDSTVSLTLPDITLTMSRIYPFKRKERIGKDRWFEKIYLSYTGTFNNEITTKEDRVFKSSLITDWNNGFNHSIPVGANFSIFKYIAITPTVNYHARWYMQHINQSWDYTAGEIARDTVAGFAHVADFNASISATTKLYGFFKPMRFLGGKHIDRIRHVFTPTVSFSYHPDFGTDFWGYYKTYERPVSASDPTLYAVKYSPYASGQFGVPAQGKYGSLNFSLNNNIEMKTRHINDSTGEEYFKKISIIDALSLSSSYNIAVDSLRWSNITANMRLKLTKSFSLNLNGTFDPYELRLNQHGNATHVNRLRIAHGSLPRLINTSTSFSWSISNNTFSKNKNDKQEKIKGLTEADVDEEMKRTNAQSKNLQDKGKDKDFDEKGYYKFKLPWTLSFDYSMRYANTSAFDTTAMEYKRELTHNVGIRGTISLTSKWNLSAGMSYDFNQDEVTYSTISVSRNLHCWNMSANIVPFGIYKSYNFIIQVSSDIFADALKYEQRSDYSYDNQWY